MSKILDFVPDIVRVAAIKGGVVNVAINSSVNGANGAFGSVPEALKQAYAKGDYNTIRDYADKTASDINPIYENMRQNAQNAFFKLHNESDDRDYYMSISGPRDNPTGYYWAYCPVVTNSQTNVAEPVAQIGTYAVNSQTLGISNKVWGSQWWNIVNSSLALLLAGFAGRYAKNRITGMLIDKAAEVAAADAGEALVAEGIISSATWASVAGFAAGVIASSIVGAVAFLLFSFIADFVVRDYWIGVNVYNWTLDNAYKVTAYHPDNSEWAGGGSFDVTELPAGGNTVRMPDGTIKPSPDTIYSYAEFVLKNKNTIFEGLGAGFRVESADGSAGFQFAYNCHRIGDNTLALVGGLDQSLDAFYNDGNNWAKKGSYTAKSVIPQTNTPILCTTEALIGRADHFYTLDVHIGLKPDNEFDKPRKPAPEKPLMPKPDLPRVPQKGEELMLPNGDSVIVVDHHIP